MPPRQASSRSAVQRVPPHSEEAECGVLGCALLEPGRVIDLCVEKKLAPEAFYVQAHRLLYETLVDMIQENRPVDLITVGDRLRSDGRLDQIGGADYLDRLIDSNPTSLHAEYYIDRVRQFYILRSMIERARGITDECFMQEREADDVLDRAQQAFFEISDALQTTSSQAWDFLLQDAMDEINKIADEGRGFTGIPTGFTNLDEMLKGMQAADMIILAARPSMGKTALALNIAERIATGHGADRQTHGVALFSLEMSAEALVRRMLCSRGRVESDKLRGGFLSKESHGHLMHAADSLRRAPIYIDDAAGLSALEVRSRARRLKSRHPDIDLVIVDYLQMMNFPQASRDGRQQEVASISSAMKAMAKELKTPVLILSQLSRAPEARSTGKPKLSDLRDSGAIEQDADVVFLLRRPCKYETDEQRDDRTLAIIDVAKHRNGPTGEVLLNFEEEFTRFDDRDMRHARYEEYGEGEAPEEGGF